MLRITPPAYTDWSAALEQQTVLEVPKRDGADRSRPTALRSARFVGPSGEAGKTTGIRPDRIAVDLAEPAGGTYTFELFDLDGWDNRRNLRYTMKVVPDLAPVVRMTPREVGEAVTPQAEIPIEMSFVDAYGSARRAGHARRRSAA